jgi:hypothetical protein
LPLKVQGKLLEGFEVQPMDPWLKLPLTTMLSACAGEGAQSAPKKRLLARTAELRRDMDSLVKL